MDEIDWGRRAAELVERSGMNQEEFAERYGIPLRTLQALLAGEVTRPQRKTRAPLERAQRDIESALGLATPEETRSEWPADVQAFLDALGRFLVVAMDEHERDAWIGRETRRIFEEFGERRTVKGHVSDTRVPRRPTDDA